MEVLAPAKINLSLRILNRRNDGFHEIETLVGMRLKSTRSTSEKESSFAAMIPRYRQAKTILLFAPRIDFLLRQN